MILRLPKSFDYVFLYKSHGMKAHNLPTAGRWALIKEWSIPTDINKGNGDGR